MPLSVQRYIILLVFSAIAVPLAVVLSLLLAIGTGIQTSVPEPVPYVFLKPHDGTGSLHRVDLAGIVPL